MEEMGRAQGNIAIDAGCTAHVEISTPKEPDFKATLVVQGCQEDPSMMFTDSPTGSRDSFFLVLSCAAQEHWSCGSGFCILASRRNRTIALAHDAKTSTATRM